MAKVLQGCGVSQCPGITFALVRPTGRSPPGSIPAAQLREAHLTAAILRGLCPCKSRPAVADIEATQGEGLLDVCHVP